jgi:hypothetical protein
MNWYWKVRIYQRDGHYYFGEIKTNRTLIEIDTIQDFYREMTECKMLLEGMSKTSFGILPISEAFQMCWK